MSDSDIVEWANGSVRSSGKSFAMTSFRDRSLATGVFLIDLTASIEPRAVNWDLVTAGGNDDDAFEQIFLIFLSSLNLTVSLGDVCV